MSFFEGDVVAKEQLPGAVGASTAAPAPPTPPAVVSGAVQVRRRVKRDYRRERLLLLMQRYLEVKVKQHDRA